MRYCILKTILTGVILLRNNFSFSRSTKEGKGKVSVQDQRIVNGRDADPNEFPYQVLLGVMEDEELIQECGGSILDKHHVLTAAHCVNEYRSDYEDVRVMVGDIKQHGSYRYRQVKSIQKVYIHEEYDDDREIIPFDIALLRVKGSFKMSKGVKPINIPRRRITTGMCIVTGWGATQDYSGEAYPEILQAVNVPLIGFAKCKTLSSTDHGNKIGPGVICAGYREGGQDSCDGDSGGPLVCDDVLVGIASWGEECAQPDNPGYYTDAFYYKDWIENKIEESKKQAKKRKRKRRPGRW